MYLRMLNQVISYHQQQQQRQGTKKMEKHVTVIIRVTAVTPQRPRALLIFLMPE
jgi:hypothetical protein